MWLCRSLLYCVCFRDCCLSSHWLVLCGGSCLYNSVPLPHYPFELWSIIWYNHKRSVQPSICFVGERTVRRRFPNILLLLQDFISFMVVRRGPYSCLFFEKYGAYADLALLVLMYLQWSLYLVFKFHSVCRIRLSKSMACQFIYSALSGSFSMCFCSFIRCDIVLLGLNATCFGMSLNKQLSPCKHGQWDLRQHSRKHTQYNRDLHNHK